MPALVCCFIVSHKEIAEAKALAGWIAEMGGVQKHEVMLCLTQCAHRVGAEEEIVPILKQAFGTVTTFVPHDEVEIPWPNKTGDASSPNHMFRRVSLEMEYMRKRPWLWLEMDAIPLKPSWMEDLDSEYERSRMPFMGCKLKAEGGIVYMSGVAIYPANITVSSTRLRNPAPPNGGPGVVPKGEVPFDVYGGLDTTAPNKFHETDLIQYVKPNPNGYADWSVSKDTLNLKAVLFHRSKDLALISHLRGGPPKPIIPTKPSITQSQLDSIYDQIVPKGVIQVPVERKVPEPCGFDFNDLTRYHVCALEGLASSPEKREDIVKMLQISGLVPVLTVKVSDGVTQDFAWKNGMPKPGLSPQIVTATLPAKKKRSKRIKAKRKISPEYRAAMIANLAKARAARKANLQAA
jgi:hypothetical protein